MYVKNHAQRRMRLIMSNREMLKNAIQKGYHFFSGAGYLAFFAALGASILMGPVLTTVALYYLFGCSLLVGIFARKDYGLQDTLFAITANWLMIVLVSASVPAALFSLMSSMMVPAEIGFMILSSLPLALAATPVVLLGLGVLFTLANRDALSILHRGITESVLKLFTIPFGLAGAVIGGVATLLVLPFTIFKPRQQESQQAEVHLAPGQQKAFVPTQKKIYDELNIKPQASDSHSSMHNPADSVVVQEQLKMPTFENEASGFIVAPTRSL